MKFNLQVVGDEKNSADKVFFSNLLCCISWYHLEDVLAKFGYKQNMKNTNFSIFGLFLTTF
jgi:hypothetical protein